MTQLYVLFGDDGNGGMYFMSVGDRDQCNDLISKLTEEHNEDQDQFEDEDEDEDQDQFGDEDQDEDKKKEVPFVFYWAEIEAGDHLPLASIHEVNSWEDW